MIDREEVVALFEKHNTVRYRPAKKYLKEGTILDENQSVVWNREQVELSRKEYDKAIKELREKHARIEAKARAAAYQYIQENLDSDFPTEKCAILFGKAYERGHSSGYHEIMYYVDEYIDFLNDMLE